MNLTRRELLALGGIGGLALAAGPFAASAAFGADGVPAHTDVLDLGPAVVQFSLMSGVRVGDVLHIGSRNLTPARVIGFDIPTRTVVSRIDLPSGYSIQALAADPDGNWLYIGMLRRDDDTGTNLYRWHLRNPKQAVQALPATGDRDVRALTVSPDGVVFVAGGGQTQNPPSLWAYDPASAQTTSWGIPDPGATIAQAVAATGTHVYFATGSVLAGGGNASHGRLWAYDRSIRAAVDILPAEFASCDSVSALGLVGDLLAVAPHGLGKTALLRIDDPSSYTVIPKTGAQYVRKDDTIYFVKVPNVWAWNLTTRKLVQMETDNLGTLWALDVYGDTLVGPSANGFVAQIDIAARTAQTFDLAAAGAPAGPQLGMGIAAGGGVVYSGGTSTLAAHTLATGAVSNIILDGEAKDAVIVDGVVYTAQYNSLGMWAYDPSSGQPPRQVVALPAGQNRPLDITWDAVNGLVLMGVQSDTKGGGCFATYEPSTGRAVSRVNPIDAQQMVRAVATADGVAYLGGDNIYPTGPRSTVVAVDPRTGTELWRLDPQQPAGIAALVAANGRLFGTTRNGGGIFVADIASRQLVTVIDGSSVLTDFGALVSARGFVYGVSDSTVFRIDPATLELTTVVAGIDGGWYSGPHIAADEDGYLYTLKGTNLVRIDDVV